MRASQADNDLQCALADLLDGTLDDETRRRLNDRLREDAGARELYLEFCETHASLAWEHGLVVGDLSPNDPEPPAHGVMPVGGVLGWRSVVGIVVGVAAVILVVVIGGRRDDKPAATPLTPVVATFVNRIDAVILRDARQWDSDELRAGRYIVERGLIHLRFPTGVTVLIESPADFEAIEPNGDDGGNGKEKLVLHSGRMSAIVPPEGVGFTVETPEAEVVDFGTEFSIEVDSGESEVHVFEGHVRVNSKADNAQQVASVDLRTEQAVRINDSTRRLAGIDLAKDRFIRSIEEPQHRLPNFVKQLRPIAYYRMPIKSRGLACTPNRFSGEVLTGEGRRPACAPGICGASLRVGGRSVGRGAWVKDAAAIQEAMTASAWVYAESRPESATILTNVGSESNSPNSRDDAGASIDRTVDVDATDAGRGRFSIGLDDQQGKLQVQVHEANGGVRRCLDPAPLMLGRWQHVVVTDDGSILRLYRDGELVAETAHGPLRQTPNPGLWIGTDAAGRYLWDGRIDELAIFDRALTSEEIAEMHTSAER
ncbi:MAG: LamG-like jellyroll fold domain-containing protein [Rubripirellula sp.]